MADAFMFNEAPAEREAPLDRAALAAAVRKLRAAKSKDALAKALKQTAALLERAPQDSEALGACRAELAAALGDGALAEHADRDVRLCAALCAVHVLRVCAPDVPFEDDALPGVLRLLLWAMGRLERPDAPAFDASLVVLQVFASVKLHIPLVDAEDEGLLLDLFRSLLGAVSDANYEHAELPALEALGGALEEAGGEEGDTPQALLELLLEHLVQPKRAEAAASKAKSEGHRKVVDLEAALRAAEAEAKAGKEALEAARGEARGEFRGVMDKRLMMAKIEHQKETAAVKARVRTRGVGLGRRVQRVERRCSPKYTPKKTEFF